MGWLPKYIQRYTLVVNESTSGDVGLGGCLDVDDVPDFGKTYLNPSVQDSEGRLIFNIYTNE